MNSIKLSPLGTDYLDYELRNQSDAIYGGLAVPGKNPGFAVIIAMDTEDHFDSHDIYLLDEYESFDLRNLIRNCGVFDYKYKPKLWIGDRENNAADRFIRELNEHERIRILSENPRAKVRSFALLSSMLMELENPYSYALPEIKRLLDPGRRQLFLKESKIINYLAAIDPMEIAELRHGDYPAIEALAFAVLEMRLHYSSQKESFDDSSNMKDTYNIETVFK